VIPAHGEPGAFTVVQSTPDMAPALEAIQRAAFPTLAADQVITAAHYRAHIARLPAGQLAVVTAAGRPVACSTDFRTAFDFARIEHRCLDAVDHNWLGGHDPAGDWLYGADIGVLPEYRRWGLARRLYEARHALVRRLNLRGHVAGRPPPRLRRVERPPRGGTYVAEVVAGRLVDPTLTVQLRCGFRVEGIIQHYVTDAACDDKAALIVWRNPDCRKPPAQRRPEPSGHAGFALFRSATGSPAAFQAVKPPSSSLTRGRPICCAVSAASAERQAALQ
jgi:GNAT superfamily N-acetyltransferase